uniref:Uncharacterized protein n=1 Tax=Anopheles maculatus TaxID=74869 RepID=A0A182SXW1_9DIPT
MSCFKCSCGCDRLSKEELRILIDSADKPEDFLNNNTSREMFKKMIHPEEPDSYNPQPSGSQPTRVGKSPKPLAIKYLELIEEAETLLRANDLSDEVIEEFAYRIIDEELGDRLCESTITNRKEVLQAIIKEYGTKMLETKHFKNFKTKLIEAHNGKEIIKKS